MSTKLIDLAVAEVLAREERAEVRRRLVVELEAALTDMLRRDYPEVFADVVVSLRSDHLSDHLRPHPDPSSGVPEVRS